jgi:hypothetical protein
MAMGGDQEAADEERVEQRAEGDALAELLGFAGAAGDAEHGERAGEDAPGRQRSVLSDLLCEVWV